eukprot:395636_1
MDCFLSVLLSYLLLVANVESATIGCYNQTDCDGLTFTTADDIWAQGYKSLYSAPSPQQSHSLNRDCVGAMSCAETSYISVDNELSCWGYGSCANIQLIEVNTKINAYGANSMMHSTVNLLSPVSSFSCSGYQACAHSEINIDDGTATPKVDGDGALSLYNSSINVLQGELTLRLRGYYAGYEAVLHCRDGTTCNIDCHHNGCGGLELICDTGATCIITNSSNVALLPNTIVSQSQILFSDSSTTTEYNEEQCSHQTTDKTFDTYQEHFRLPDLNYNTNVGPICCRGYFSCGYTAIYYNDAVTVTPSVVCSADSACRSATIQSNRDIIIECSAYSCYHSTMTGSMNNGIVYCYGYYSCGSATITSISIIICSGYWSCDSSNITSNGDMAVYFYGYRAGYSGTSVTCSSGDQCHIICDGYESCGDIILTCDGDCFIECNEDTLCPNVWTATPTSNPTNPTAGPTMQPTILPTNNPTIDPTSDPSNGPSSGPTIDPTRPSVDPTRDPTIYPTFYPSNIPTFIPSSGDAVATNATYRIWSSNYTAVKDTNDRDPTQPAKDNEPSTDILLVVLIVVVLILIGAIGLVGCYFDIERRKRVQDNQTMVQKEVQQGAAEVNNNNVPSDIIEEDERMDNEEDSIDSLYINKDDNQEQTTGTTGG